MAKPTYEELFKSYMRCEEDREELILENDCLHDIINKAIEYIEKKEEKQIAYNFDYWLDDDEIKELLNILKGSDTNE